MAEFALYLNSMFNSFKEIYLHSVQTLHKIPAPSPLQGNKIKYNGLDKINPDNAVYRSYISWRDWF